ncbi:DNA mismatch repair protein msh2, putative [Theileria annulata]|uniref:DNA mismatch repair protein msh2, putative n=1 Tax=Theileria annulata TaxID=5874 RepID=Q4UH10_THEAN|nr:DNA mismatch repair protein msh2, putative [Theileria annulata]CAI73629.1 DNA mismatch repair protein msh2, putative [Theileria annulata]|eukprot:XP_954306.1 DNA mismatch repair protein msh2, putative [Theileria annulata]
MEDDSVKNHMKEINLKLAMKAFCLTADFINYKDRNYKSHFTLSIYTMDNYLCLDRAAFTSLSILPFNTHQQNVKMSLYDLLNKCRTSIGSQLLKMWITQPLVSVVDIKKRQDCVEAFKSMYRTIQSECLRKVQNLDQILTKFKNFDMGIEAKSTKQPSFEDLVVLYDCIISANRLNQFTFKRYDGIHSHTIRELFAEPLSKISSKFESYLRLVEKTVDLKEAENRVYVFNRNFDESLKKISSKLDQIRYDIEGQRQTIQNELPYSGKKGNQVKIVECNTLGFLFRIPKKDQPSLLKAQIPGVNIEKVRLNKNEFLFTTPKLRRQCTLYKSTLAQYEESQDLMVKRTFKVACTYWSLLERFIKIIATLDVLTAFAEVATLFNYVRPTIDETGKTVNLVDARHPLVEYVLTSNSFIPNDLYMERDRSRVHITTGPNMGGKSTYIKQVGLIAIMNQIGSFVPCKKAKLPIFKHILCRIGASDIQLRGVSTFLAEMVESAAILRMANEHSLVIIDELGRGTSTHDGFGLSWAIVVDLIERAKCFCLCATHFHEMGSLALEHFGVVNKHLTAQFYDSNNSMTFLYKVKDGVCKKSFGINVAIIAKFPPDVIESARNKLKELEHKYSPKHTDLIKDLLRSPTFTEFKNSLQTLALEA